MSDNEQVVQELFDAFRHGDVDGVLARCDPGVEFSSLLSKVEGGTYRGHDGIRRFFADQRQAWERWEPSPDELEVAGDMALVVGKTALRGRGSGAEVEVDWAYVMRLRAGKVVWGAAHADPAVARSEFEAAKAT